MRKLLSYLLNAVRYRTRIDFINLGKFFFLEHSKAGRPIPIRLKGYDHPILLRPNTSDFLIFRHVFLYREYPIFKNYQPTTIIDAGANIGLASIYFKKHYPDARILAIEPEESNCRMFKDNLAKYSDVILLQGVLLGQAGLRTEIVNPESSKSSFQTKVNDSDDDMGRFRIPSYSINQLMEEYQLETVGIVKIDIEGAEKDVFSHNTEWIANTENIFIELHDHYVEGCSQALIEAIIGHGFIIRFSGENLVLTKKLEVML